MYSFLNKKFAFVFAWTVLIVVLLLIPMPESNAPEHVTFIDKIVHAFLFGTLSFLIFYWASDEREKLIVNPKRGIIKTGGKIKKRIYLKINKSLSLFLIAFFVSISLSIILEYTQAYVPGRSPSDYDLLSGVIGVILVLAFIYGDNYSKK